MREKIDVNWSWWPSEDHAKLQLPETISRNGRVLFFVEEGTTAATTKLHAWRQFDDVDPLLLLGIAFLLGMETNTVAQSYMRDLV